MALVITIAAADVEPQMHSGKEVDLSLSDYGSYSLELSFPYLSDDEFSSHNSSRRSSKDVPRVSSTSVLQCADHIPLPPPPPPLPRDVMSIIHIPTPPSPPPLPHALSRGSFEFSQECNHGSLYTGYCPNPNCMNTYRRHDHDTYHGYDTDISDYNTGSEYDDDVYAGAYENRILDDQDWFQQRGTSDAHCIVCFSKAVKTMTNIRKCCSEVVCKSCIGEIVRTNIEEEGNVHIVCPNPECKDGVITKDEILGNISGNTKARFDKLRMQESEDNSRKTCPNCCLLTEHKIPRRFRRYRAEDVRITCSKCQFEWCFRCHAPWHPSVTCKQLQKGNKPFKQWTKTKTGGNANCQKCPLCRVYIQRSTGCNHMTCNRCETEFCYQCGGLYRGLPGLGNHYSKMSVFGCTTTYKSDQPMQRKALRGGYLAAKVAMLTGYPVLFVAGVAVVLLVGAVALPIYGGYKYYRFKKKTNQLYKRRRRRT